MYFFTADMHIGHSNIIHLCKRPFNSESHMTSEIISRHNSVVTDNDDVFDLGDVGLKCSADYLVKNLEKMNGRRHILFGNHDKPLRQAFKRGLLNDMLKDGKITFMAFPEPHKYPDLIADQKLSLIRQINVNGQDIVVSHYATRTWWRAFRGTWHLFGHSHSNMSPLYRSFDVGVDDHNFMPWSWNEIVSKMEILEADFKEN